MADLQPWAVALIAVAAIIVVIYLLWRVVLLMAPGMYRSMIKDNAVSVDDFVGGPPNALHALKSWAMSRSQIGSHVAKKGEGYSLKTDDSDKVLGLKVTSRNDNGTAASTSGKSKPPVVVGTIRMGFGHHRIAYAATSWGLGPEGAKDRDTWFHDFLNIESEEAQMIKDMDKMYSKGSRLASEVSASLLPLCKLLFLHVMFIIANVACDVRHSVARGSS